EQGIVHLPVMTLIAGRFRCSRSRHGIGMDAYQWEMVEFEPELFRISVQNLFHKRMIGTATRALVIAELHKGDFGFSALQGTTDMSAPLDIHMGGHATGVGRLIGTSAQVNSCPGGHADGENDHNKGLNDF